MTSRFTPEEITVNDLFSRDTTYIIPEYQRPYSWEAVGKSDKNNQVNVMWDDLWDFYSSDTSNRDKYFLGSMVMIDNNNNNFEVIDGQQRLTTLFLLFASIKCLYTDILNEKINKSAEISEIYIKGAIDVIDDILYNKVNSLTDGLSIQKKIKIQQLDDYDLDNDLTNVIGCAINNNNDDDEYGKIIRRYFNNRDFFYTKIKETFLTNNTFNESAVKGIGDFVKFLKDGVSIIMVKAINFDIAYHVFEVLNNRGLPLSNKDLLRNFFIKEFKIQNSTNYRNDLWNKLEEDFDFNDEFISRYVESKKGKKQKNTSFNEFKEIYTKDKSPYLSESKIDFYFKDFTKYLDFYQKINEYKSGNDITNSKVKFLLNAYNSPYSLNLLLALFNYYSNQETTNFNQLNSILSKYEIYLLSILLGINNRFSSSPSFSMISSINNNNISDIDNTINYYIGDITSAILRDKLIGNIKDNDVAKLILAKYFWIKEYNAEDTEMVSYTINFDKATLEHICPQTPETSSAWNTPDYNTRTYLLGNMTLLNQKLNSRVKNAEFGSKKEEYKKSNLSYNNELANLPNFTTTEIDKRTNIIADAILADLGF